MKENEIGKKAKTNWIISIPCGVTKCIPHTGEFDESLKRKLAERTKRKHRFLYRFLFINHYRGARNRNAKNVTEFIVINGRTS